MTKHEKTSLQRLLAMLLCLVMVVGIFPVTANAEVPSDINPDNVPGVTDSDKETEAVYLPLTFRDAHVDGIFFEHDFTGYDVGTDNKTYTVEGDTPIDDYYDVNAVGSVNGILPASGVPEYTDTAVQKIAGRIKAIIEGKIKVSGRVNDDHTDSAEDSNIIKALRGKNLEASTTEKSVGYNGKFESVANFYDAALWYLNNLWADGMIDENTPHMMKVGEFNSLKLAHVTSADATESQYHYGYTEYYYYEGQDANQGSDADAHYTVFDTDKTMIYNTIGSSCPEEATNTYNGQWWPLAATMTEREKPYYTGCDSGKLYFSTVGSGKFVYHKPVGEEKGLFFSFTGDDDVYLFINNKLVIDAGRRQSGIIAFVDLESPVLEHAVSTTKPNGQNNFTYEGTGVMDPNETWAEYLELEDGGIYEFKFFHMERQNSQSKFSIYTNIKVVNPAALTQKHAYDKNGEELAYGADVPNNVDVTYGLELINDGNSDVYYLSYSDPMLGVKLDYNTCDLGEDESGNVNSLDNLTLYRTSKDGTVERKVDTKEELMNVLKEGLKQGESLEIRGFTYNVGAPAENATKKVIKNTLTTSVIGVSTNSTSWIKIPGTADMVLTTTAVPPTVFVLDYAKDLILNSEDVFGNELTELTTHDDIYSEITINGISLIDSTDNKKAGTYGTLTMSGNDPNEADWNLKYQLNKFLDGEDKFSMNLALSRTLANDGAVMSATVNKNVSFIPANNVYYEDDFYVVDEEGNTTAGIVYSGDWTVDKSAEGATENHEGATENHEGAETEPNGGVHGWEDSLADDTTYSDGSAHYADAREDSSATATFTFTGTGVDIYSYTNSSTGTVIATLKGTSDNGVSISKGIIVDNLSASGDYYQIPTLSFNTYKVDGEEVALPHGTYTVTIKVTTGAQSENRFLYYLDGIRVYNPLADDSAYAEKEQNAIFTEVRDILATLTENEQSACAVFIDKDEAGNVAETKNYEETEYGTYGPKNEVYLAPGQAITFKVDTTKAAYYYVGLKSPEGKVVDVNYSGVDENNEPATASMSIQHTTDMYYEVVPDGGYITIENAKDPKNAEKNDILSVTKIRATGDITTFALEVVSETDTLNAYAAFSARKVVEDEQEPIDPETPVEPEAPEKPETPDVEIQNPTEPEAPEKNENTSAQTQLKNMLTQLFQSLMKWFR